MIGMDNVGFHFPVASHPDTKSTIVSSSTPEHDHLITGGSQNPSVASRAPNKERLIRCGAGRGRRKQVCQAQRTCR